MSGPTRPTIKRLFAVSGNCCAFPGCDAPLVDTATGAILGEICHVKARSSNGPRYDAAQSEQERHAFENLLLLCPNHHAHVDADPGVYTVEELLHIKAEHEARHAGGAEPSDELARRFLLQLGLHVEGDLVLGPKIIQQAEAAAVASLYQIPPPPADFTGREEELAELLAGHETGGVTISGLRGMGGSGRRRWRCGWWRRSGSGTRTHSCTWT